jgi:Xylose isomerase-like TIM barrel
MVPELPALASPLLARHLSLGCSTGFMAEHRDDWERLVVEAAAVSSMAIELSALSSHELPGLLAYLRSAPRLPFQFVSVHAPSKDRGREEDLVRELAVIPAWIDAIVIHPDTISEPALYRRLGRRLALENMDTRKAGGHTADDLDRYFTELPSARLCLDLAHAKDVDPTMDTAASLLQRFSSRLSHVHLSSLDEHQHHVPLTIEDETLFGPLLARCRDVPWILEAPPPS